MVTLHLNVYIIFNILSLNISSIYIILYNNIVDTNYTYIILPFIKEIDTHLTAVTSMCMRRCNVYLNNL